METVEKNATPLVDAAYSYVEDYKLTEEFFLKGKRAKVELKKNEERGSKRRRRNVFEKEGKREGRDLAAIVRRETLGILRERKIKCVIFF